MKLILVCFWLAAILLGLIESGHAGGLKNDFYKHSCPGIEDQIRQLTWNLVARDFTIPPRLLRMHFHDCFVRGCDASVLLDSTDDNDAEKSAGPNLTLQAFDVIDNIKEMVESICPGTVSCADILALAARDAVSRGSGRLLWDVKTGRKDGRISEASEASANLPSPSSGFNALLQAFNSKGLSLRDLVVLSGAHTIGVSHCNNFSPRLFPNVDPSLNSGYAGFLRGQCRSLSNDVTFVGMDPGSSLTFDNRYYRAVKSNRGLFVSDAALLTNEQSSEIVDELLDSNTFFDEFKKSMERMSQIGVLRDGQGEIRERCNVVNS